MLVNTLGARSLGLALSLCILPSLAMAQFASLTQGSAVRGVRLDTRSYQVFSTVSTPTARPTGSTTITSPGEIPVQTLRPPRSPFGDAGIAGILGVPVLVLPVVLPVGSGLPVEETHGATPSSLIVPSFSPGGIATGGGFGPFRVIASGGGGECR